MLRRRQRSTPDRWLNWKVGAFFLAAGLWLGGVRAEQPWLTGAAIGVLLVAIVLRIASRERDQANGVEQAEGDDD